MKWSKTKESPIIKKVLRVQGVNQNNEYSLNQRFLTVIDTETEFNLSRRLLLDQVYQVFYRLEKGAAPAGALERDLSWTACTIINRTDNLLSTNI